MLSKLFDTLANMGIWIRFNDKRTEPPTEDGRIWGPVNAGFTISLAPLHEESVSVLIKNTTDHEIRALLPAWLQYLKVNFAGAPVPLKPYGKQLLESTQASKPMERVFPAGAHFATEIPIGALYDLTASAAPYRVTVQCPVPGHPEATLLSNEVALGS